MRQGEFAEADASLKRALKLDANYYLAHYYYASSIRQKAKQAGESLTAEQFESMRSELAETLRLAPHFVEPAEMLAELSLQQGKDLDESIRLLEFALQRSPGRESLSAMLARVWAAQSSSALPRRTLAEILASETAPVSITVRSPLPAR
jgi:tetratricopeptide (TPR) repeat protein